MNLPVVKDTLIMNEAHARRADVVSGNRSPGNSREASGAR
jgi:hypothetical protein